jgi:taurine dioxygenase
MTKLELRDLTPAFGTEVRGYDPAVELDDEERRVLKDAFDRRGLVVFRGIDIDRAGQTFLVQMFAGDGYPSEEAVAATVAKQKTFMISNIVPDAVAPFGELLLHSDAMWSFAPYEVLSLYGEDVAPPVPPTQFVSTTHAWQALPDDLRARVEGLEAVHSTGQQSRGDDDEKLLKATFAQEHSTTTPVGYRNPRTGTTMLYVCPMMTHEIVGLSKEESDDLLAELFTYMDSTEHSFELHWQPGDLAIWDNLAVQHARPDVTTKHGARTLRKVAHPPVPGSVGKIESPKWEREDALIAAATGELSAEKS